MSIEATARFAAHSEAIATASARAGGLMRGSTLRALGISAYAFGELVRSGELVGVRRGVYVEGAVWMAANLEERYRMGVRAAAFSAETSIVASHLSAAVLHGLPLIGRWPRTVHVATPGAAGGSSSRLFTAHRSGPVDAPTSIDGCATTPLLRTLIDVASTQPFLVAVTMCDHVLLSERRRRAVAMEAGLRQHPLITREALFEELARVNPSKGFRKAERAIAFSTELAESPGESLSRVRMLELGFEIPELQAPFTDVNGDERRTDFFWRRVRKVGEFDGRAKYLRGGALDSASVAGEVLQEKRREDALRPLVNSFVRWDWDTCFSPARFNRFLNDHDVPHA